MSDGAFELAAESPVLSYILTEKDYYAMADAGRDRASQFLSRWAFWPFAIANFGISAWFIGSALKAGIPVDAILYWNGAVAAFMILGRYGLVPLMRRWYLRQSRLAGRQYEVRFGKDAIDLLAGGLSTRVDRSEILSYRETEEYFFFGLIGSKPSLPRSGPSTPQRGKKRCVSMP